MLAKEAEAERPGPLMGVSIEDQIAAWDAFAASGGRPEEHPAIAPHDSSPGEDFEFIGYVTHSKHWTDQGSIQCNLCGRRRKFNARPGFVAAGRDGYWYVIGPDCQKGTESQQRRMTDEAARLRRRKLRETAGAEIRQILEHRSEWLTYLKTLEGPAEALYLIRRTMKEDVSDAITDALTKAAQSSGYLMLFGKEHRRIGPQAGFLHYKKMIGASFLAYNHAATRLLNSSEMPARFLFNPLLDDKAVDETMERLGNAGSLPKSAVAARQYLADIARLHAMIVDAKRFLDPANLATISSWVKHKDCTVAGFMRLELKGTELNVRGNLYDHFVDVAPILNFTALPPGHVPK